MRSSFSGLYTALRALIVAQEQLDITGHNISNAATPGYKRQRVDTSTPPPYSLPGLNRNPLTGQVGSGIKVVDVRRHHDPFFETQFRNASNQMGSVELARDLLQQMEAAFNEPNDNSLNAVLNNFWNAWADLSNNPETASVRSTVREQASNLSFVSRAINTRLVELRADTNRRVTEIVAEINTIAKRINQLNREIVQVQGTGQEPNDAKDERDRNLTRLARLVNISAFDQTNGEVTVTIGGIGLVQNGVVRELTTATNSSGNLEVRWAYSNAQTTVTGGDLYAVLQVRDVYLKTTFDNFNTFIANLIKTVNDQHKAGRTLNDTTGVSFFSGSETYTPNVNNPAGEIALASAIISDLNNIAAATGASPVAPGNNSNAIAITNLRSTAISALGSVTLNDYYQSIVTGLGTNVKQFVDSTESQTLILQLLENFKESVGGVNLDEEAINLVQFQRSYQAAARVVTVLDEVLDRIINGTGLVGR
jgi:flagellar hook-associated protein 1 FlgK